MKVLTFWIPLMRKTWETISTMLYTITSKLTTAIAEKKRNYTLHMQV